MRKRTTRGGRKKRGGKPITFHADIKSHGGSQLFLGSLKFANWCYVRKPLSMSSSKELSFLCTFTDTFTKVPVFIEMTFHPLLLAAMKVMIQLNMANMCLKIACAERSTFHHCRILVRVTIANTLSMPDLGGGCGRNFEALTSFSRLMCYVKFYTTKSCFSAPVVKSVDDYDDDDENMGTKKADMEAGIEGRRSLFSLQTPLDWSS